MNKWTVCLTGLASLLFYVLICLLPSGEAQAGQFVFTKKGPRLVKSTGRNIQLTFPEENSVEYLITQGDWKGWHINCQWTDSAPTSVQEGEVIAITTKCAVVSAGAGSISFGIAVYMDEGDGDRLIDHGSAGAGRSGSTGQLYGNAGHAKYRFKKASGNTLTLVVQASDGGGTEAVLATYAYTYGGGSGPGGGTTTTDDGGGKGKIAFCSNYARRAVAQNQENQNRKCGYYGARWQSSYDNHYGWCLNADTTTADYETRARDEDVGRCAQGRGGSSGSETISGPTGDRNQSGGANYLGCFKDQGDPTGTKGRDLSGYVVNNRSMNPKSCIEACRNEGFKYAGTQYSSWCFCGDSYGRSGKATNCDMPCAGNGSEICGGAWANSVYSTGAAGKWR